MLGPSLRPPLEKLSFLKMYLQLDCCFNFFRKVLKVSWMLTKFILFLAF